MSKREKTSIQNVFRYPSGALYYRKGKLELPLGTDDIKEALDAKEVLEAKTKAFGARAFKLKMKALLPAFLIYCKEQGDYRPRSLKEIEEITTKYLKPFFGNKKMADIDESLWLKFTETKVVSDYANQRKVMNLFLNWAREREYYLGRPIFKIPKHKRRQRRILTPDQIRLLFTHARGEFLLFCTLTLMHHLRRGEAVKLQKTNIHLVNKFIDIIPETVKTKKGRKVPINDTAVELINHQLESHKFNDIETPYLFPHRDDPAKHRDVSRAFIRHWERVQRLAKGELDGLTYHDFRATGETYSHKSKDHTETQREKFSGASNEVQKRIYVSMSADDVRGLENAVQVEGLNEILNAKLKGDR